MNENEAVVGRFEVALDQFSTDLHRRVLHASAVVTAADVAAAVGRRRR